MKDNKKIGITVVIVLLVLGLISTSGYILYDKVIYKSKEEKNIITEKSHLEKNKTSSETQYTYDVVKGVYESKDGSKLYLDDNGLFMIKIYQVFNGHIDGSSSYFGNYILIGNRIMLNRLNASGAATSNFGMIGEEKIVFEIEPENKLYQKEGIDNSYILVNNLLLEKTSSSEVSNEIENFMKTHILTMLPTEEQTE